MGWRSVELRGRKEREEMGRGEGVASDREERGLSTGKPPKLGELLSAI